jgi:hypothetical protein
VRSAALADSKSDFDPDVSPDLDSPSACLRTTSDNNFVQVNHSLIE